MGKEGRAGNEGGGWNHCNALSSWYVFDDGGPPLGGLMLLIRTINAILKIITKLVVTVIMIMIMVSRR